MAPKRIAVTITYVHPGTEPPVYLAGSFSDPAWIPEEMDFVAKENNEYRFYKEVMVEEGTQHQYKFRIGTGDWWALDENTPTVVDDAGNRNNLLSLAIHGESATKASDQGFPITQPETNGLTPKVEVESNTSDPPQHKAERDTYLTSQSQQNISSGGDISEGGSGNDLASEASVCAETAAEVADAAVIFDREPSPAPLSDREAGRVGERRLSNTPIIEVADTAAEVADSAAIVDRDDMKLDIPTLTPYIGDHSGPGTPWQEQAPLFAHECLGPHEEEKEPQSNGDQRERQEPLLHNELDEEPIDINDPLLEPFPEDRLSILAHVRSTESRLSEDETNFEADPISPLLKNKRPLPGFEEQPFVQLDLRSSPSLDPIMEESQEESASLPDLSGTTGSSVIQEMNEREYPSLATIAEDDPPTEMDAISVKGFIDSEQDQSRQDYEIKKPANSVFANSDAATMDPTGQVLFIPGSAKGIHNGMVSEVTTYSGPEQVKLELEHPVAIGQEAVYGQTEQASFVNSILEASGGEPMEQENLIHEIDQETPIEPLGFVAETTGISSNDIIDQDSPIAELSQNTVDEIIGKERSTSASQIFDDEPAKGTSVINQDENDVNSAECFPSDVDDYILRSPLDPLPKMCTQDHEADSAIPAMTDKCREAATYMQQSDLSKTTGPEQVDSNPDNKDNEPFHSRAPDLETAKDGPVTQNLPTKKLSENSPAVLTPGDYNKNDSKKHLLMHESTTPATRSNETPIPSGVNVAKSTATSIEQPSSNDDPDVKKRNRHIAERSVTPASIRPPGGIKETRNFLQVLWRTVFVEWIGGFFARLCGDGRRP